MGEVQGVNQRLADIGIDMAGQRAEPSFHGVHALADAGETQAVDDALDSAGLVVGSLAVLALNAGGSDPIVSAQEAKANAALGVVKPQTLSGLTQIALPESRD